MENYNSPLNADYTAKYDDKPRTDLINLIKEPPDIILEIGCGSGATGAALKEKYPNLEYFGLEYIESAAKIAETRLDKVITGDIQQINLDDYGIPKGNIDIIICADVLEHLYDPWKILFTLRDYLKPGGKIVASIPNTQNIELITHLLNGHWTYGNFGLLDATHIRFFTLNEIAKLFSGTGYHIINAIPRANVKIDNNEWPKDLDFGRIIIKNVTEQESIRLRTFQYLIVAEKIE